MLLTIKRSMLCCCLFGWASAYAQTADPLALTVWDKKPILHIPDGKYDKESAVILFDKRVVEYADSEKSLEEFRTIHKRIHINDDRGIEGFNKIYLEVTDNADIKDIRARTILPNGHIIEVDQKNIKDIQEKNRTYKIFAMEGLEKGCEVEYYYTYKTGTSFFGKEIIQGRIPVLEAEVKILAPDRLIFDVKGYNNLTNKTDTITGGKRIVTIEQENIPAVEDEQYSAYDASLKRVEYKLSYNNSKSSGVRLFTWNELAKLIFQSYAVYSDKELKRTEELIKREGWKNISNDTDKIVTVENYIKKNIGTREDISSEDASDIDKIIKTRIASHRGIVRLFGAIFSELGLSHEFVLCGSRDDYEIDKSFENWNNAENAMIYFPDLQKYICPTLIEMRFPWINPVWGGTNGLFCKPTLIGSFSTAIAVIKPIKLEPYNQTQNNITMKCQFNNAVDTLRIQTEHSFTGYSSVYYRSSYNFSSQEDKDLMLKNMVKFGTQSENIISSNIRNSDFENFRNNKPFIMDATVNASELVEKAGNKTLIKIGELIGLQTQIYDEKPRQFPIHLNYPHIMDRNIELEIPEGYRITNLDALNMKSVYSEDGEPTMGFESSYRVENNKIIIHILEEYRKISYPISQYDEFKKIINTSADFNKVMLALEKK